MKSGRPPKVQNYRLPKLITLINGVQRDNGNSKGQTALGSVTEGYMHLK